MRGTARAWGALALTLALAIPPSSCEGGAEGGHVRPGERLPEFSVFTTNCRTVTDTDLLGKPSVVALFDARCADCRLQLAELEAAHRSFPDHLNVLAIARDEPEDEVRAYWRAEGLTMDVAAPGDREAYDLFDRSSGSGIPQVYVCDAEGTVTLFAGEGDLLTAARIHELDPAGLRKGDGDTRR